MKHATIPFAAFLLIIAAGFQHRQQNQREVRNKRLVQQAAESLEAAIPLRIGDWSGEDFPSKAENCEWPRSPAMSRETIPTRSQARRRKWCSCAARPARFPFIRPMSALPATVTR